MREIDLSGKTVLEIGAGDIRHMAYWKNKPLQYLLADISDDMMELAKSKLDLKGISYDSIYLKREQPLPLLDNSVDAIVSFYSLEHFYPLQPYLQEMLRVLKPGGTLIGAIPAEGGLAWGGGQVGNITKMVQEPYRHRSR